MKKSMLSFNSLCVREIKENRTTKPHVLPIYATSSFEFDNIDQGMRIFRGEESGHVYSRFGNPTVDTVAAKIALLETHGTPVTHAEALLFSSGMSAILTLMLAVLKSGDKILTQANLYGGTTEQFIKVLAPNGIVPVFTDLSDIDLVQQKLKTEPSIKMIYGESPANPTLACIDLEAIAQIGSETGVYTTIDNTFMTPYLQQPFKHGIDFVIHSTTKYLNGHGNSTAGVLISGHQDLMKKDIWRTMKLAGTNSNAWDAWLVHNGLKTLPLRMDRHCKNAMEIAKYLDNHSAVEKVNYPGLPSHRHHNLALRQMSDFGGMLSFEVKGGLVPALSFLRKISFCSHAPTLGDVDTLIMHPASASHVNLPKDVREAQGIVDGLIRLSVGIEDAKDIIADLGQALP